MDKDKCQVSDHVAEVSEKSSMILLAHNNDNLSSELIEDITEEATHDSCINVTNVESTPELIESKISVETIVKKEILSRPLPSLYDESRLVKFSLPSNSINFIQTNTPFLNKSRHFLNFITEKSTNIMEKALLPQHMATRINHKNDDDNHDKNKNSDMKMSPDHLNSLNIPTGIPEIISIIPIKNEEVSLKIECNDYADEIESSQMNAHRSSNNDSNHSMSDTTIDITTENDDCASHHEIMQLKMRIKKLEMQNNDLASQNKLSEIESRDKTIERLTNELRDAIMIQEEMRKEYTAANKEKENMVMKYAVGEKQLIEAQKAKDITERKMKDLLRDYESLQCRMRNTLSERAKICGILDAKCRELTDAQKDVEKYKGEIEMRDIKLKWTQNKLKSEMEMYKENGLKLERAMTKINEMKDECDQVRRESQETIRKVQQIEINKSATLDQQLKEQHAQLILERHITEDKETSRLQLQKEIEILKNRLNELSEENNSLHLKTDRLEKDQLTYESNVNAIKAIADERQREMVDLNSKLSQFEAIKLQLIHKEQCLTANETELERLRRVNQELKMDMDCCREREVQMLDFTQKLTDKNVRLQSEFSTVESKATQLEIEQGPLREHLSEMKKKMKLLEDNWLSEKNKRIEECEILAKHIAEQTQLSQNLTQMLEDSKGENSVMRRKHQLLIKEMTRELQQNRKKLEIFESASANNLLAQTSRTSSDTSLNVVDISQNGISPSDNSETTDRPILYNDLDKTTLIEKILKMQRVNVRRAEKLDFLEEHTRALVMELQRKTKIIQNYILHENFDAMGNNERDKYKAELVRHGGIMASVYNHRVSDDTMTLELSLEINQKLQAVLEDALLKNITLKDNIDTLGEEIARLSIQNQRSQRATE